MNHAQRKIVVRSLFSLSALAGLWAAGLLVAVISTSDREIRAPDLAEVALSRLFWAPLVSCLGASVLGIYVRAGGTNEEADSLAETPG